MQVLQQFPHEDTVFRDDRPSLQGTFEMDVSSCTSSVLWPNIVLVCPDTSRLYISVCSSRFSLLKSSTARRMIKTKTQKSNNAQYVRVILIVLDGGDVGIYCNLYLVVDYTTCCFLHTMLDMLQQRLVGMVRCG